MTASATRRLGLLASLAAVLAACATATAPEAPAPPPAAVAPPTVAVAPPPPPPPSPAPAPPRPSARALLAAPYNERAEKHERDGELRQALEARKIALTIDPADAKAQAARKRVEGLIERGVTERIEAGRAALGRGARGEAHRRFLSALALDPRNAAALEALRTEAPEQDYVQHTVRTGDTLATLAQQYYGDRARSEVIADTNQLALNARLAPGRTIKIPEIPGVPFVRAVPRPEMPPLGSTTAAGGAPTPPAGPRPEAGDALAAIPPATTPVPAPPPPAPPDYNPLLAEAEEALERRQYAVALADVDKVLAANPGHAEAMGLKKQTLYRLGRSQYDQKSYDAAYRSLTQLARLQPNYEGSAALLEDARRKAVDQHYGQGIRLYREEKLREAIAEWRVVLELEPGHANARRNIDQSERLLKGLEDRRKK